ncbi:MAG TPA: prephenate dehydrogenase/arogenate dehydrogenase family protein [Lachnospiraceae bacterium]|nr:prephenate dehydrogenase/arogenate dehydrogenase family protein [Lachnospiraceae bacterium]
MYKKIGFIGLGLIGGSIARAIRREYKDISIVALDDTKESIENAYKDKTIDNNNIFPIDELRDCDIIFLCAPVIINISYLPKLKAFVNEDIIITDVGSVKGEMEQAIIDNNLEEYFIGGHPMCGSEKTGYSNSNDRLLENAYYLITNNNIINQNKITTFKEFISSIGALPLELTPDEHDYVTASISHVPHIIASSLVNFVMNNDSDKKTMKTVAAGGFKDITRIASSSPTMWQNICLTNKDKILKLLDSYLLEIDKFKKSINKGNADEIKELFAEAKEYRDSISTGKGLIENVYEFYVDIADETGVIARIATILANENLNIKNIGIINNREYQEGALRIEMYDEFSMFKAINVLRANKYSIYS